MLARLQRALAGGNVVDAKSPFAAFGTAIDHFVDEQIVMPRTFPNLWVHDNRAFDADHFVRFRGAGGRDQVVVPGDHVAPPGFFDVALELHTQRPVVPKPVEAAVDFARLKNKAPPFAQRDEFVHVHGSQGSGVKSQESGIRNQSSEFSRDATSGALFAGVTILPATGSNTGTKS